MSNFIRTIEALTGKSCQGLSTQESAELIWHCPEFFDNPRKFLIALLESLPDQKQTWTYAFGRLFILSCFADDQLSRSADAIADSAHVVLSEKADPVASRIQPEESCS